MRLYLGKVFIFLKNITEEIYPSKEQISLLNKASFEASTLKKEEMLSLLWNRSAEEVDILLDSIIKDWDEVPQILPIWFPLG